MRKACSLRSKVLLFLMLSFFVRGSDVSAAEAAWLTQGEVLAFDVSYKMGFLDITAGQAELRYEPQSDGHYTLSARAWNLPGVRGLIQMRDRIVAQGAHVAEMSFATTSYSVRLNENDYQANKHVSFNRVEGNVTYQNLRAPNEPPKKTPLIPQARDLFSALYSLRALGNIEPEVGTVYTLPIRELDRDMTMDVHVLGRESLKTPAGRFRALHVQPISSNSASGRKKDKLHIWVTDDARRMPLRIELRLGIGAFTGELAGFGGLDTPSRVPADLPLTGDVTMIKKALPHANPL